MIILLIWNLTDACGEIGCVHEILKILSFRRSPHVSAVYVFAEKRPVSVVTRTGVNRIITRLEPPTNPLRTAFLLVLLVKKVEGSR